MMMWTVVPETVLFHYELQEDAAFSYKEIEVDGIQMLVQKSNVQPKQYEIVRLLSTNPQDYLNAQYQPGRILDSEFSLQKEAALQ